MLKSKFLSNVCSKTILTCLSVIAVGANAYGGNLPSDNPYQLNIFVLNAQGKKYNTDMPIYGWLYNFNPDALLIQEDEGQTANSLAKYILEKQGHDASNITGSSILPNDGQTVRSLIGGDAFYTTSYRYAPVYNRQTLRYELQKYYEPRVTARVQKGGQNFEMLSVHFKGDDKTVATNRFRDIAADAALIGDLIDAKTLPTIIGGDFNAGDTSALGLRPGETYPTPDNYAVTMNIIKQSAQMFQSDSEREPFTYQKDTDPVYTWPNPGYGCSEKYGCWSGWGQRWDRAKIDHVIINRPYAKWFFDAKTEADLAADMALRDANYGGVISDHNPTSAKMGWVMPISTELERGNLAAGIALKFDKHLDEQAAIAGDKAPWYDAQGKEFHLSRINNRTDMYLGQIFNKDGTPILSKTDIEDALGLDDPQTRQALAATTGLDFDNDANAVFKIRLDCSNAKHLSLAGAKTYCVDDHSRFKQMAVTDGQTVAFDETAALGDAHGEITLDNGGLRAAGQGDDWATNGAPITSISQTIHLQGSGWINISDATSKVDAQGVISGAGNLIKRGLGTLVLSAQNTYQGGTTVENGTLRAANEKAFVQNSPYKINGGTLDLNGFNLTVSSISGDNGTAALGGGNLTINQQTTSRFAGIISGNGNLNKLGSGTLVLDGKNTFTGETNVANGGLIIGSISSSQATITGNVNVQSGAFLGGHGSVGSLHAYAGSIIAPGNSIGTLHVNGDLRLDANSTYYAEIDQDGNNDHIAVAGKAVIDNANLYIAKAPGNYLINQRYTLLSANNGVEGKFGTLDQNLPFINLGLSYDANNVHLDVLRNKVLFPDVAVTKNQVAVASNIEKLGSGNPIFDAIVWQNSALDARKAYDQLSGEIYASQKAALINESDIIRNAVFDRLSVMGNISTAKNINNNEASMANHYGLWVQAIGQWSNHLSDSNAAKLKQSTGGALVGLDGEIGQNSILGLITGYSRTSMKVANRASSSDSNNYHIGIYGGTRWDATALNMGAAYSWHKVDTDRYISFAGFNQKLSSDYDAHTLQGFAELSHRFDVQSVKIEPFANLAVVKFESDAFHEYGGDAYLRVKKYNETITYTTLGLRTQLPFEMQAVKGNFNAMFGWQHQFNHTENNLDLAFSNSDFFAISGVPVAKNNFVLDTGLNVSLTENTTFGVKYSGKFGNDYRQNSVKANLMIKF